MLASAECVVLSARKSDRPLNSDAEVIYFLTLLDRAGRVSTAMCGSLEYERLSKSVVKMESLPWVTVQFDSFVSKSGNLMQKIV